MIAQAHQSESRLEKALAFVLNTIGAVTLFALMLITCLDVFGRYVFNMPLTGATELTEFAVGIVVFSVLPIVSWRNEHIVVDMLDRFTGPMVHLIRTLLLNAIMAIALIFVGQRILTLGARSLGYGEVSEYLGIPVGWPINFIGIMCYLTAATLFSFAMLHAINNYKQHKVPHSELYR